MIRRCGSAAALNVQCSAVRVNMNLIFISINIFIRCLLKSSLCGLYGVRKVAFRHSPLVRIRTFAALALPRWRKPPAHPDLTTQPSPSPLPLLSSAPKPEGQQEGSLRLSVEASSSFLPDSHRISSLKRVVFVFGRSRLDGFNPSGFVRPQSHIR